MKGRILFLGTSRSDYLEDLTLVGLREVLGGKKLVSLPRRKYYISSRSYPKNIARCRRSWNYFKDTAEFKKIVKRADYGCVVIGSTKKDAFSVYNAVAERIPKNIPVVYIDGGDEPEVGGDAVRLGFEPLFREAFSKRIPDIIFKREYLKNKIYPTNVFPLPLSYGGPSLDGPPPGKKYDVVFWAVDKVEIRAKVLDFCRGKWDCDENGTARGQEFKKYDRKGVKYLRELASAKVCYNFRGGGWDTLRYWEIPAVGSLMISGKPEIVIPDDFKNGKQAIFCKDDLSDLEYLTDYYLKNEKEREEIAAEGRKHFYKYHTAKHRAEYVLNIIKGWNLKKH